MVILTIFSSKFCEFTAFLLNSAKFVMSSCRTQSQSRLHLVQHSWIIDNFSFRCEPVLKLLFTDSNGDQIRLTLSLQREHPIAVDFCDDFLAVDLYIQNRRRQSYCLKLSILDSQGKKLYTKGKSKGFCDYFVVSEFWFFIRNPRKWILQHFNARFHPSCRSHESVQWLFA